MPIDYYPIMNKDNIVVLVGKDYFKSLGYICQYHNMQLITAQYYENNEYKKTNTITILIQKFLLSNKKPIKESTL